MTKPAFLKPDNFPLAQVVLILYALITTVIAMMQVNGFVSAIRTQTTLPMNLSPTLLYLSPAIQNFFLAVGMATLAHQLGSGYHKLLWRVAVAVIGLQVIAATLQLTVQFNLLSVLVGALGLFGLASLFIGRDDATDAIPIIATSAATTLVPKLDHSNEDISPVIKTKTPSSG